MVVEVMISVHSQWLSTGVTSGLRILHVESKGRIKSHGACQNSTEKSVVNTDLQMQLSPALVLPILSLLQNMVVVNGRD